MAIEIFIARHGQNEDNVNGILNGHRDLPLTDIGRNQARQLGQGILDAGLDFDVIYCSPLSRAHETAQIVAEVLGHQEEPTVLELLIERDFGVMTGLPITKIAEMCEPDVVTTDTITYFLSPEGAETFPQLIERGHEILTEVNRRQKTGKALLVCHGDIGKMTYAAATGREWREVLTDFHFGNGELIELSPDGQAHVIELEQHNL
jgi:broad specificity phosphatase PhoE